jgi:hemoglobin
MGDSRLYANLPVDEAHHRGSAAGFKSLVTEVVCWASGGPQQCSAGAMQESHQVFRITEAEWDAILGDLQHALDNPRHDRLCW